MKNQTSLDAEALSLVREAGYHDLTSFQRKVVPFIVKGKDTVVDVEFSYQRGKTVAFILPLLLQLKKSGPGIKAIVLAPKTEDLTKIFNEFKRFHLQGSRTRQINLVRVKSHSENRGLLTVLLSEENEIRTEVRSFTREPDIIVSSPGRLIDHMRRGNVSFSDDLRIVISIREIEPGFLEDLQFIYSKLPSKRQTVIFSPESEHLEGWSILRRPRVFKGVESAQRLRRADHFYLEVEDERKRKVLLDLIASQKLTSLLVFCEKEDSAAALVLYLKENKLRARRIELSSGVKEPNLDSDVFVLTDKSLSSRVFTEIKVIINFDPPGDAEAYRRRCSYLTGRPLQIFTFVGKNQFFNLNQIQEMLKVRVQNREEPTEEDIIKGSIERIVKIIKEQEDPDELNRFRRIVKKHVPIFLRSYFMAYLFKQSMGKHEARPDKFTTLFISIGKNRRVYPRDLVSLFMSNLKINRSDIGVIKVFDNYSFLDVSLDHASDAISTLSGTNFRGRRITVNRARKKNDSQG